MKRLLQFSMLAGAPQRAARPHPRPPRHAGRDWPTASSAAPVRSTPRSSPSGCGRWAASWRTTRRCPTTSTRASTASSANAGHAAPGRDRRVPGRPRTPRQRRVRVGDAGMGDGPGPGLRRHRPPTPGPSRARSRSTGGRSPPTHEAALDEALRADAATPALDARAAVLTSRGRARSGANGPRTSSCSRTSALAACSTSSCGAPPTAVVPPTRDSRSASPPTSWPTSSPGPTEFAAVLAERAALQRYLDERVPPPWFDGQIPDPSTWSLRPRNARRRPTAGTTVTGIAVSGGAASGPARVDRRSRRSTRSRAG